MNVPRAVLGAAVVFAAAFVLAGTGSVASAETDELNGTQTAGDVCSAVGPNTDTIVLVLPDGGETELIYSQETETESATVYDGTIADLVLCVNGAPESTQTDWLPEDDRLVIGDDGPVAVAETSSAERYSVEFRRNDEQRSETELSVPEREAISGIDLTVKRSDATTIDSIDSESVDAFASARTSVETSADELETATESIADGDEPTAESLSSAERTLEELRSSVDAFNSNSSELSTRAVDEGVKTGVTMSQLGTVAAATAETNATAATAVDAYRTELSTERSGIVSSLRITVLGLLGVGLVLGSVLGAIVPTVAARRATDAMQYSRNVDYDRRALLIPVAAGVVLGLVGLVALGVTDGSDLLEVML